MKQATYINVGLVVMLVLAALLLCGCAGLLLGGLA